MSLLLATLLPGLFLLALGLPLFLNSTGVIAALKAMPRSTVAAGVFFTTGALWFLWNVWHLSNADFGEYHTLLTIAFGVIAALSFRCVPDFLAVRGLAALTLLAASPLLDAGYMIFDHWQIYFYKVLVYVAIVLAIWLGASPFRLRDFFEWLFARPARTRTVGAAFVGYGLLLAVTAFTY